MKIRCKKIFNQASPREDMGNKTLHLAVGKEYVVLCVYAHNLNLRYQIESDEGDLIIFDADQFNVLSNYIPSNWEVTQKFYPSGSYSLTLSPKNWNNAPFDFYEEITEVSWPLHEWRQYEKIPKVVSLYFQERDLIYREEEEYEKRLSPA